MLQRSLALCERRLVSAARHGVPPSRTTHVLETAADGDPRPELQHRHLHRVPARRTSWVDDHSTRHLNRAIRRAVRTLRTSAVATGPEKISPAPKAVISPPLLVPRVHWLLGRTPSHIYTQLTLLTSLYSVQQFGAGAVAACAPALLTGLGMPESLGFVVALPSFAGLLFNLPGGILIDRAGKKKPLIVSTYVQGVSCMTMAASHGLLLLVPSRFGMGVSFSIWSTAMDAYQGDIVNRCDPHFKGRALGIVAMTSNLAYAVGPLAGGWLADATPFGVTAPLLFVGASTLLTVPMINVIMEETPSELLRPIRPVPKTVSIPLRPLRLSWLQKKMREDPTFVLSPRSELPDEAFISKDELREIERIAKIKAQGSLLDPLPAASVEDFKELLRDPNQQAIFMTQVRALDDL